MTTLLQNSNSEIQLFSPQKQDPADLFSVSCISTEECAVTLLTSQDDCFSKLPALNEALQYDGLPLRVDSNLSPVLYAPVIPERKDEATGMPDLILPPLAVSRFDAEESVRFKTLYIKNLQSHLCKENIPIQRNEIPLELLSESLIFDNPKYTSMYKMILEYVLPRWRQYLSIKNLKNTPSKKKRRADSYKKKVMRDLREFFRILFRKRFHASEYKTSEGVRSCMKKFFIELGFSASEDDLDDLYLFKFLHQTHKNTLTKSLREYSAREGSPFNSVDKFNYTMYNKFLTNSLSSQIFFFVFGNFQEFYLDNVKDDIKEQVSCVVRDILQFYKKLEVNSSLSKYVTDF
ncbi:unnamed protein product [Moneuplotes crassus]|uniref:Uncharacterized protein n=1 Tax=Euplotes crassus TaxID=5936 RepID=A0AAD1U0D5_EUPCR|nr:unnamed protein product [Moneuplotes crassus]